ncbi:GGDEF domain-containing protein [Halomonas sp. PAMB 3232]|uniref:GGDEF domain-containing protein n=1 Tax=Halomonas sp. PAMB 3232 TaxID=3075221 RepID=UPI0028967738|nr:GGDEF domain-containing protein [Halomonas sp. PAMB 3232]WNL38535.1 GGDEF domain-containing protein [Halomonas sp. PAMB 3232]
MDDRALAKAVDAELSQSEFRLNFPSPLEAQFEADTQSRRRRSMLVSTLIATPIYFLFLANDYTFRSDIFDFILLVRVGAVLLIGMPAFWLLYRGVTPFWRETLVANIVVGAMVASCIVLRASQAPFSYYDVYCFGLILVAGNTFFPLRFTFACVTTAVCIAVMLVTLVGYEPMPIEAKRLACLGIFSTALFTLVTCYRLERNERRAYLLLLRERIRSGHYRQDNEKLSKLSLTDPLTNIGNRRQFEAALEARWQEASVSQAPLSLLIIDVDHFKAYNDHYGHPEGDECLRRIAAALQAESREIDQVARIGGEEFALLLANISSHQAYQTAERVRRRIEALHIANPGVAESAIVTVSIGVAVSSQREAAAPNDLLARADVALYQAKLGGRNRTFLAQDAPWQKSASGEMDAPRAPRSSS